MYVFRNFLEKEDGKQQYMTIGVVSISKEMIKKKKKKKRSEVQRVKSRGIYFNLKTHFNWSIVVTRRQSSHWMVGSSRERHKGEYNLWSYTCLIASGRMAAPPITKQRHFLEASRKRQWFISDKMTWELPVSWAQ